MNEENEQQTEKGQKAEELSEQKTKPSATALSGEELDRVAGGANLAAPWPKITGSRSNIKNN